MRASSEFGFAFDVTFQILPGLVVKDVEPISDACVNQGKLYRENCCKNA